MFKTFGNTTRRAMLTILAASMLYLIGSGVGAMRSVGDGEPVPDGPWPDGAVAVANLKSRFRYSSGDGGDNEFLYRGDTAAFQLALATFAKIRAPKLELFVHEGPFEHWIANDKNGKTIDWSYTLHDPETWHSIYNNPQSALVRGENKPVPAPRIDVYVGTPPTPNGIDWALIKVPDGITVKDQRGLEKTKVAGGPLFHGVIYNAANGKTVAGAAIEAQKLDAGKFLPAAKVTADAVGAYKIEALPPGQYRLVASAKSLAARVLFHQVIKPDTSTRLDGELSAELTVKGSVTDEQDKPLKDVDVQLEWPLGIDARRYDLPLELKARTDADGRFTLAGVPTGYAQFTCTVAGHIQVQPRALHRLASWHALNANRTDVALTGDTRVDLRMTVPGSVRCVVTSANALPLDDTVNVTIAEAEGGVHSRGRWSMHFQRTAPIGKDGSVEFRDLAPGRYYVVVGYWVDLVPDTQLVTVNAGKSSEVKLVATMRPKPAPAQDDPPKPAKPPKPPTTDDRF